MKERLTGAIILVALIVLLVPELLSGPLRTKTAGAMPGSSLERRPARPSVGNRSVLHSSPALPFLFAPHGPPSSSSSPNPSPNPSPKPSPKPKARPPIRSYTLTLRPSDPTRGIDPIGDEGALPDSSAQGSPSPMAGRALLHRSPSSVSPRAPAPIAPAPQPARAASPGGARALSRRAGPAPLARGRAPSRGKPQASARWVVQLASFTDHTNALRLAHRLRLKHLPVAIAPLRLRGRMWWRVWVGPVSRAAAGRLAQRLRPIAQGEVLRE